MTLYADLGVEPGADPETITRAYRRKAQKAHPDAGGDLKTFHAVQHAYEVLSDPAKRAHYDRTGEDEAPKVQGLAEARLLALFEQLMDSDADDLVSRAKAAVQDSSTAFRQQRNRGASKAERLSRVRNRVVRTDDGPNAYQKLIDAKVRQIEQDMAHCEREIEINDIVLEILEHYRDDGVQDMPVFGAAKFDFRV